MMNYSEFLDLSERLHELLREYSPSIPRFRRSPNPVLLGLVHKIRQTVIGRCIPPGADLTLPYQDKEGGKHAVEQMYGVLRNITCGDAANRYYPYVFKYGTYRNITKQTVVGLHRQYLETYLQEDIQQLLLQYKQAILMDNPDFPEFWKCAPSMNWHALQVACRFQNLRRLWQLDQSAEKTTEELQRMPLSTWQTMSRWCQLAPCCSGKCRRTTPDEECMSVAVEQVQTHHQNYTFSPMPVRMTDQGVAAVTTTAVETSPLMRTTAPVRMTDQGVAATTTTTLKTSPLTRTTML